MIFLFLTLACSRTEKDTNGDEDNTSLPTIGGAPLGDCVIAQATGEVPDDLYQNTGVQYSDDYAPFTKSLMVNGITLLGSDENTDEFMISVGDTISEIFTSEADGIDTSAQATVIQHLYERKTVIPMFVGDDIQMNNGFEAAFDLLLESNSICDVIFEYGGEGQTMEVIEHILHHVSMVGLHYSFANEWGVTQNSVLYRQMVLAEANGYYNHDYNEIDEPEEALRVRLQEYAYWVITSDWDIQEDYGGDFGGGEWTLPNPQSLSAEQPDMAAVFPDTIDLVIRPPRADTLASLEN